MKSSVFLIFMFLITLSYQFNWQAGYNGGSWAMDCDFIGKDTKNFPSRGEDCYNKCLGDTFALTHNPHQLTFIRHGCTHFTWTDYNGGTCWLKMTHDGKINPPVFRPGSVCGKVLKF